MRNVMQVVARSAATTHGSAGFIDPSLKENIMLVLSRRIGEEIVIGRDIRVTVLSVKGDRVRLGITAPRSVCVDRQEVHERRFETSIDPDHTCVLSGAESAAGI
jgi:carbon storage regulator